MSTFDNLHTLQDALDTPNNSTSIQEGTQENRKIPDTTINYTTNKATCNLYVHDCKSIAHGVVRLFEPSHRFIQERRYLQRDQYSNDAFFLLTDYLGRSKESPASPYVARAGEVRPCHTLGSKYSCKEHGSIYKPNHCHIVNLCVICGNQQTKTRTRAVMSTFNQLSERPELNQLDIVKIVFTLPESIQAVLNRDNIARFTDLTTRVLGLYHNNCTILDYLETSLDGSPLGERTAHHAQLANGKAHLSNELLQSSLETNIIEWPEDERIPMHIYDCFALDVLEHELDKLPIGRATAKYVFHTSKREPTLCEVLSSLEANVQQLPLILGGVQTTHTWHSNDPILRAWYPHVHSFWNNYVQDPETLQFHQVHSFMDVSALRFIYRAELVREFGQEATIPARINLHCDFIPLTDSNRPQLLHNIKYALRRYQLDVVEYSNYYGITEYSEEEKSNILSHLLAPGRRHNIKWFGFLSNRNRRKLNIHREPKSEPDKEIRCPVCQQPCEYEGDCSLHELENSKSGFHYPWDSGAPIKPYEEGRG